MQVRLGSIHSDVRGFDALAALTQESGRPAMEFLDIDFSNCQFFEANMAAPFYAILVRNFGECKNIRFTYLKPGIEKILCKNHFLTQFGFVAVFDANQTTLPFKVFTLSPEVKHFADYLEKYMQGRGIPYMSQVLSKKFHQSLHEIFQNAALHSNSKPGIFTCGQFYPNKKRVDFTISDAGIGIRQNVRRYLRNAKINSCEAIKWAMQEGHTTKTGKQPGGLGLKLIKDFIRMNKGRIQIVSRHGFYEFSFQGETIKKMGNDFPGTCVNIEINTNDAYTYCLTSELHSTDIF